MKRLDVYPLDEAICEEGNDIDLLYVGVQVLDRYGRLRLQFYIMYIVYVYVSKIQIYYKVKYSATIMISLPIRTKFITNIP